MNSLRQIAEIISRWIDSVAAAIVATIGWLTFPRVVHIIEDEKGNLSVRPSKGAPEQLPVANGRFADTVPERVATMLRGCRAELVLRPDRFLFRPLELPARASEFLDGIVRSQIDRLTPWSVTEAVFGWSKPVESGPDRIMVTVAATPRLQIMDYMRSLSGLGADSIAISTPGPGHADADAPTIRVLDEKTRNALDVAKIRRIVGAVLLISLLAAAGSFAAATVISGNLETEQNTLMRKLAERRAALRGGGETATTALGKLEQRKHETPSSAIVIEALSQILPDHTYVTELRIEGDKLRVTGVTKDAPSLIRLIEQSSHFASATFFAPTTRQPSDPGERFHIEAKIEPVFKPRS